MRRSIPLWSVALVAAPLAISHPDSSVTELRVAGGSGSYAYVTRGCDNSVISKEKIDFDNVGAEASHKFTAPVRIGVRGGIVNRGASKLRPWEASSDVRYLNPYLSFDWPGVSFGGGWVAAKGHFPEEDFSNTASGHVRFGKRAYWEASYMEAVPLVTSGYALTGLGFRMPRADLWLGLGILPQDAIGFVGRGEYRFGDRIGIGGIVRIGSSEGVGESGFAVSLSYRFTHRTERPAAASPWAPPPAATAPAASDSARSPRRGRSRAPRGRRSRRAPC